LTPRHFSCHNAARMKIINKGHEMSDTPRTDQMEDTYIKEYKHLRGTEQAIFDEMREIEQQLAAARAFIVRLRDTVIGWRERDHPDGFDRRTAEIIADWIREECKMKTGQATTGGMEDE